MDKLKLDKLKIGRRGSMDDRRKSVDVGRRLSKLIAPKRRKRKDAEEAAEEEARGRKEGDVSGSDLQSITSSVNQSQRRDSIADSLLTDEETEYVLSLFVLHLHFTFPPCLKSPMPSTFRASCSVFECRWLAHSSLLIQMIQGRH